jgi:hypothetical protein
VYLIEIKLGQHARIEDLPAAPLRKDRKITSRHVPRASALPNDPATPRYSAVESGTAAFQD